MAFDYNNYYKIDWIQSTGTQYIDTGLTNAIAYKAEIDFQYTDTSGIWKSIYGVSYPNVIAGDYYISITNSQKIYYNYTGNIQYNTTLNTNRHQVIFDKNLYLDGVLVGTSNTTPTPYTSVNISLFTHNCNSGYCSSAKIYSCKMSDQNGSLVRDFVPARRKSDNVVGLYDTVNEQFYTNAGTGEFIGAYSSEELDRLQYLVSPANSYFDTGLQPGNTANWEVDLTLSVQSSSAINTGIIYIGSSYYESWVVNGTNKFDFRWNNKKLTELDYTIGDKRNVIYKRVNGTIYFKIDNQESTYANSGLRAVNLIIGRAESTDGIKHFYKCKIYMENTLKKEYIPVKRKSDNVVGFYDLVDKTFSPSTGGSQFTAGPILQQYTISLATNPANKGILSGAGQYYDGDECTISYAEGDETYRFVNWSGSAISTNNPYTFTVSGNASFTANLERYGRCILL